MKFNLKTIRNVLVVAAVSLTSTASMAQYRLPATHASQHKDLIANQAPVNNPVIKAATEKSVIERESQDAIFNTCWNSQSVNPYGGAAIPATKTLDVSDFHMPVPGAVTSHFGWRPKFGRMHKGVDMRLSVGDTVRAAFSGKIRLTKFEGKGYGYYVVIRHDNGMETVYGHLSKFLVKPNQRIKAGQPIALGGNTGRSTGPHLHFETRYMGLAINPEKIIDFAHKTTFSETFAFDRAKVQREQNQTGRRSVASASNSKSKTTASKNSSKKRSSKRRR